MTPRIDAITRIAALSSVALVVASSVTAQETAFGKRLYEENCVACHGPTGKGDGAVAALFNAAPPSLRKLSEMNGGVFPFELVYTTISGEREVQAHGIKMPVWGSVFRREAVSGSDYPGIMGEEVIEARKLALTYYVESLQE
ncbi:c-type cytochrome [Roseovarius salis]|uniref:c-type cytochrome n=1 Tax=Roseovarius salis TaxID=3376063 RepID=UPI0037C67A90